MRGVFRILLLGLLAFSATSVTVNVKAQPIVTILYSFGGTDGLNPDASLIQGQDGCLQGNHYDKTNR